MAILYNELSLVQGIDQSQSFVITNDDGSPTNLGSFDVHLIAYDKSTGIQYLATKTAAFSSGVEGVLNVATFTFTSIELIEEIDLTYTITKTSGLIVTLIGNGEIAVLLPANYYGSYWTRSIDFDYQLCQDISNKHQRGNLKPDVFNRYAKSAVDQFIKKRLPVFPLNQQISDDLINQLREVDLTFTTGQAIKPGDYQQIDMLSYVLNGRRITIDVLPHDKFAIRESSSYLGPENEFPIAKITNKRIHLLPNTITSTQLSYLRRPITPKWNYSVVNSESVYDPVGSQDFEFPDDSHDELCMYVLQMFGINVNSELLLQFSTAKTS